MASCNSPDKDCVLCPRLKKFRLRNRKAFPDKFNAAAPAWRDALPSSNDV